MDGPCVHVYDTALDTTHMDLHGRSSNGYDGCVCCIAQFIIISCANFFTRFGSEMMMFPYVEKE